jgi:N-acetylneuraminic acid mutarotase
MARALSPTTITIFAVSVLTIMAPPEVRTETRSAIQLVAELPGEATTILAARDGAVYLVVDGHLMAFIEGALDKLDGGNVSAAAIGVDESIYYTRDDRVLRVAVVGDWQTEDVTDRFGTPAGDRRVCRTPDGRVWVEGASRFLNPDGTTGTVPEYAGSNAAPIPSTRDLYANYWTIAGTGSQAELLVLPANAPEAWQVVPFPEGSQPAQWSMVLADDNGMVWIGGAGGLRQLNPYAPDAGWKDIPGAPGLQLAKPTAMALSPNGMIMAGLISGQVMEINLGVEGELSLKVIGEAAATEVEVQTLTSDGDGNTWVVADNKLYRVAPGRGAWQKQWQALGRLPGGNHDIFAAVLDGKLYTSGGATSGWGYPAQQHLFDELWVYDPGTDVWRVVGHMPFHRCYNGIAALAGEIWNVGGAIHEEDNVRGRGRRLPLDDVDIYDPSTDSWRGGPRLLTARQEPVVVTANGRIYAIGGAAIDEALDSVESIGPGETTWRSEPPMLQPMRQYAGCVLDGVIYVVSKTGALSFDPKTAQWSELPTAPQLPQASQVAAHDGQVWVLGNYKTDEGYRYSPADSTWRRAPNLPTPNSWGAAAELGGRLIVAGGAHKAQFHFIFDDRMYALRADWEGEKK